MSKCYRQYGSTVSALGGFQSCYSHQSTNGFMPCCGTGHTCLDNGFCYNPSPDGGQTGYYMALCTDPTYTDAACPKQCIDLTKGDAVYNTTTNLWSCCGQKNNTDPSSAVSCNKPTSETFEDPSPKQLQSGASATTSSTLSTSSSSLSTSSRSSSLSTTISSVSSSIAASSSMQATNAPLLANDTNQGLTTGAKIGAALGAAFGILMILGLILFFVKRSRRARRDEHEKVVRPDHDDAKSVEVDAAPRYPVEMAAPEKRQMVNMQPYEKLGRPVEIHEMPDTRW